jgi:predicted dehydrogenase
LYGGILCDIGSHQVDQFLYYTGSTEAEVVASQIANVNHHDHPRFQDFGDMMLRGDKGLGYVRLDWFTPDGLGTWGDGRLFVLGTEGYIELRKYTNVAVSNGGRHRESHARSTGSGAMPVGSGAGDQGTAKGADRTTEILKNG